MGIKQLYNDNLRKLPNEYGDVSVMDLKRAFDTVWHDGLFLKLQHAGINGKIYNVITYIFNNSHSNVKCKQFISDPTEITKGVHQGNVLSPLLFNIFINNIVMILLKVMFQFCTTLE